MAAQIRHCLWLKAEDFSQSWRRIKTIGHWHLWIGKARGFHDTCRYTAAHDREFLMQVLSLSLILHFPFFHSQSEVFQSSESNTFSKTNRENIYVFGWKHTILLHNSGPAWLTPSLFCHSSMHCVYFVSSYSFLYYHLHIFLIRLQIPSRSLKCSLMGERANAKGYLMNYHVKAAGETPNCVLPVWIENRANRNALFSDYKRGGTVPALFPDSWEECLHRSSLFMNFLHCWFIGASRFSQSCKSVSGIDLLS